MTLPEPARRPIHYAWIIVVTGTLCIVACLGFGRFALGMLLPSMASTLKLSYSQIGFISTGNFLGYLASVLFCGNIARKMGSRRLIIIALIIIGVSMALISQAGSFSAVLILYTVTGMGSGAANVPVMGLIRRVLDERPSHAAPAARFRNELEDYMSEDYADETLKTIVSWGRYAELFAYDEQTESFSLENPH